MEALTQSTADSAPGRLTVFADRGVYIWWESPAAG